MLRSCRFESDSRTQENTMPSIRQKNTGAPKRKPNELVINFGTPNPKQVAFLQSKTLYTAYGGARGGGKSWAVRVKAVGGALEWEGIRILIIRRTYPELQQNHIEPIIKMVPGALATYNGSLRTLYFRNGSYIKFGHANSLDTIEREYQGQEYDWIFMDEATQFSYQEFRTLGGCLRGVNDIPKRFYLTCNPGGIGHQWVKRLFVDRDFHRNPLNPEEDENPKDYLFIPATVEDNTALLSSNGGKAYKQMLASLPEKIRQAHRYGDWNALSGAYFSEFKRGVHTCDEINLNPGWLRYRTFDYGLDMFAMHWVAVAPNGRCYVYREYCESGLIVSEAAQKALELTPDGENIMNTFSPPDMWNRQKDTGKSMAELFYLNGVSITKASNNRVQGHMQIKQMLSDMGDGKPGLIIFNSCKNLIDSLEIIQADDTNPNDCAKSPHDLTHVVDSLRYFCVSRTMLKEEKQKKPIDYDDIEEELDYEEAMTGGEPDKSYLGY